MTNQPSSKLQRALAEVATQQRDALERLKENQNDIYREDFLWHYLLQSFSTMGRSSGWFGLIENQDNYKQITFEALSALNEVEREETANRVCRAAKVRMPTMKAKYILGCFDYVNKVGGLQAATEKLFELQGREEKIKFLRTFPGIGPKYARNIMMDVYHEDFRDSIAIDVRIKRITEKLGLTFRDYKSEEVFYLDAAKAVGLNGWEADRILYNFTSSIEERL